MIAHTATMALGPQDVTRKPLHDFNFNDGTR